MTWQGRFNALRFLYKKIKNCLISIQYMYKEIEHSLYETNYTLSTLCQDLTIHINVIL